MITAEQIKSLLNLEPLPHEGGFFVQTYKSNDTISRENLADRYTSDRSFSTAIYYLLTPDTFSALHRLPSDEIYHFYFGDPVEMLQLRPDGSAKVVTIGTDILNWMEPQVLVRRGVWHGSRLCAGGSFCLLGATVAPGFEFADYEAGEREELVKLYPEHSDRIMALTR